MCTVRVGGDRRLASDDGREVGDTIRAVGWAADSSGNADDICYSGFAWMLGFKGRNEEPVTGALDMSASSTSLATKLTSSCCSLQRNMISRGW